MLLTRDSITEVPCFVSIRFLAGRLVSYGCVDQNGRRL